MIDSPFCTRWIIESQAFEGRHGESRVLLVGRGSKQMAYGKIARKDGKNRSV